jgi:hypothetical protein
LEIAVDPAGTASKKKTDRYRATGKKKNGLITV